MNSTHKVEVIRLGEISKHPNADTLGTSTIFDGYPVVVKLDQWKTGDLAAYVPPDSVVDALRPEFAFLLDPRHPERVSVRIRTKRLRGIYSMGLLIPAPEGASEGDDVAERLGVTHYEPPMRSAKNGSRPGGHTDGGVESKPPPFNPSGYDLESFRRYGRAFREGEPVIITEKLHGANARFTYQDGTFYVGSRNRWLSREMPDELEYLRRRAERALPDGKWLASGIPVEGETEAETLRRLLNARPQKPPTWWQVVDRYLTIEAWCRDNPGCVLYGEVYGPVQDMTYGEREPAFAAFDVLETGPGGPPKWWDAETFHAAMGDAEVPTVPVLYRGPFLGIDHVLELAEGQSTLADHVREGCVVRPERERFEHAGRVHLKAVGNGYMERP